MKQLTILLAAAVTAFAATAQRGAQPEITFTPQQKLHYAEKIIESYYVDDVNSDKIVQDAIVAMLKTLDPHSSYSDPEETKELTTPLEGNFSGIGIQFNMLNDTLFVIQTTSGGPSEKVGILPGDRLLTAGDSILSGVKSPNSRILKILRGPKGSEVDLKVLRRGVKEPLNFSIIRDDIPIYSVDAAYMADPKTGYIRISRFAEETDAEFRKAVKELRAKGMKQLIIDLEDNGGGYLNAAHQLASHFLKKGDLVVYTDAPKMGKMVYDVEQPGDLQMEKVVILANQYSASASEILSGAIQDNDRGLIVGRRTFGKGLVQRPFPFPDGSMIRLTVSKYYTPSGRSIQKPYEAGDEEGYRKDMLHRYEAGEFSSEDSIHLPDSLRFETLRNHRPVYGGGGIMPDLFVPIDTTAYSDYYRDLVAKGIINRFSITYVDNNRKALKADYPDEADFISRFEVTEPMMQEIVKMGETDSVKFNQEQFDRSKAMMATIVKGIIGRDLFETSTYFKVVNPVLNPVFRAGLDLINNDEQYNRLLREGRKANKKQV
ncbi:MAG: S41 family peptidase [Muribaculaceae bacterium]|nr:S41 family peptidase [Muribaculaceae bacterium]